MLTSPPAGLDNSLVELCHGGDKNWRPLMPFKAYTNAFVWNKDSGKILLGYKKRGIGKEMFNGFGGKVEPGETPLEAATRELEEEACIKAKLEECGMLLFVNEGFETTFVIHMFAAQEYEGEPTETDEMRPEWFAIPDEYCTPGLKGDPTLLPIPLDNMWQDDQFWMPYLLSEQYFVGRADFGFPMGSSRTDNELKLERWWFGKPSA